MDKFFTSLAYKYVAMTAMLALSNHFAEKAQLPIESPLNIGNIQPGSHVSPPRLMGFGGSLVTTNYFFGFNNGYLANFKKVEPNLKSDAAQQSRNRELATFKSKVDAAGAYQLATNWLTMAGIDIQAIEAKHGHKTTQRTFLKNPLATSALTSASNEVLTLPVFDIEWGRKEVRSQSATYPMPMLVVTIYGHTKELVEMHITDDSIVGGGRKPVRNVEALLAITDEEFMKYDSVQRSNLVGAYLETETPTDTPEKPAQKP